MRILLVEDNDDHALFARRALLRAEGLEVEIDRVADGEEAIAYLRGEGAHAGAPRPHVVVLDLKMPRKDGFEVLAEVKADPDLRRIPIIVLTSSDEHSDIMRSYDLGTNSYVIKPRSTSDLIERIKEIPEYWSKINTLPNGP